MLLTLILLLVFLACIGFTYAEGLWSNTLRLINVVMAAVLATNFFETTAAALNESAPTYTYVWDFLALWLGFVLVYLLLQSATDAISRVKVRCLKLADRIGGACFGVLIGWVMICFATMTLHTAPLCREPFAGGLKPESAPMLGIGPDRAWLGFVQNLSLGAFCRPAPEREPEKYAFDPKGEFVLKYATRRARLESHMALPTTKSLRVIPGKEEP